MAHPQVPPLDPLFCQTVEITPLVLAINLNSGQTLVKPRTTTPQPKAPQLNDEPTSVHSFEPYLICKLEYLGINSIEEFVSGTYQLFEVF